MEYSYVRKITIDNPYVFVIDGNGVIRDDFGYSAFTKDLFEGNGLIHGDRPGAELERVDGAEEESGRALGQR